MMACRPSCGQDLGPSANRQIGRKMATQALLGWVVVVLTTCAGLLEANVEFSVVDCARDASRALLTFPSVRTSPHPIVVPGRQQVSGSLRLTRDVLDSHHLALDLTVQRYLGFFWLTLPCINNAGSCRYTNPCNLFTGGVNATCAPQFANNNLPCRCPFRSGTYVMPPSMFEVPEISGAYSSWLKNGDYRVTAKLIYVPSGQELACQRMMASLMDGNSRCSGFLCSFFT